MPVWIALLRGINVGGNRPLPMAGFRTLLTGLGYSDVTTYIQSGNAVFSGGETAEDIAQEIRQAIAAQFGFEAQVFVLSARSLDAAIAANPYPQAAADPKTLHLFFFRNPPNAPSPDLDALLCEGEAYAVIGTTLYLYTPDGFGRSGFANRMGRYVNAPTTARNLRSCIKIAELATAIAANRA